MKIHDYLLLWNRFPRWSLAIVTIPLVLINGAHSSLMPYDEGYYAVQARWIWETGDWLTPQFWGTPIYDRTLGIQWAIALAYHLFGSNEFSVRLPSAIACIASVLLTYEIGKILFNRQIAWLGAAILMLMGLWVSEAHTAQQNTALVTIELLGIWALLQIADVQSPSLSSSPRALAFFHRSIDINWVWGLLAGATVGWGFLLKGFMIVVPIIALLPYTIDRQRYRTFLTNPGIYLGLILGAAPTVVWLLLSCYKYESMMPVRELFGKLLFLSKTNTYNPGPFYYLWMMPLNIFPWALFSAIGVLVIWRKFLKLNYSTLSLSVGYPLALFVLLSLFRTRMIYYTMQILPFMALLAAVAFIHFTKISSQKSSWYRLVTWLSYAFSGLGILLASAGIIVMLNLSFVSPIVTSEIRAYALPAIVLGCGWMSIARLWHRWQPGRIPYWLAGWFIPAWFTILTFGWASALADKSPEFRTQFDRLMSDRSIATQSINLLSDTVIADGFQPSQVRSPTLDVDRHKTLVLLSFYTPRLGKHVYKLSDLPDRAYAWTLQIPPQQSERVRLIDKIQGWQLIQKIGKVELQ